MELVEDKEFKGVNFVTDALPLAEYDQCIFDECDFSNVNLSQFRFVDCTFKGCNLTMINVQKSIFRDVLFKGCKMLGIHFNSCNPIGLSFIFEDCQVNHSIFSQLKLKGIALHNCTLHQVDFTDTDLSACNFDRCDLSGAIFDHSNLKKTDFSTAINYNIDPESNDLKGAKFSYPGVLGLLSKYKIDLV